MYIEKHLRFLVPAVMGLLLNAPHCLLCKHCYPQVCVVWSGVVCIGYCKGYLVYYLGYYSALECNRGCAHIYVRDRCKTAGPF